MSVQFLCRAVCVLLFVVFCNEGAPSTTWLEYNSSNSSFTSNCSATNAYVLIISPASLFSSMGTILSAQALFPPYIYSISSIELVQLDSADGDSLCGSANITTNVTNKLLLLWSHLSYGNCTDHLQVYNAERFGAAAVLIANSNDGDIVYTIVDDNSLDTSAYSTTIVARMISQNAGTELQTALNENSSPILVQISCDFNYLDYPEIICVSDGDGIHYYLDGEYQKQATQFVNDHPLYIMEGYSSYTMDIWIYLEDYESDSDWRWVVGMNEGESIAAKCSETTTHPGQCSQWFTYNSSNLYSIFSEVTFALDVEFHVNESLCSISDNYICISTLSNLSVAGLTGTYRQWTSSADYWFREYTTYDATPGFLTFENGYFNLYDPVDYGTDSYGYELIAYCSIGTNYSSTQELQPWLCSTPWSVRSDESRDRSDFVDDLLFSITQVKCNTIYSTFAVGNTDILCMSENSVMHAFLEGEYKVMDKQTPSGRNQYSHANNSYFVSLGYSEIYLWWLGEYEDNDPWWIMATADYYTINSSSSLSWYSYGYCPSYGMNPAQCSACWYFYWRASQFDVGAYHVDCKFEVAYDICPAESTNITYTVPQYICVELSGNYTYEAQAYYDEEVMEGAYNRSSGTYDGYAYWYRDDDLYGSIYIYFDEFYGYWRVSLTLGSYGLFICLDDGEYDPSQCGQWYDYKNSRAKDFSMEECTEDEYWILRTELDPNSLVNDSDSESNVEISSDSGIVVGCFIGVLLGICLICTCLKYRSNERKRLTAISRNAHVGSSSSGRTSRGLGIGSSIKEKEMKTKKIAMTSVKMENRAGHQRVSSLSVSMSQELGQIVVTAGDDDVFDINNANS